MCGFKPHRAMSHALGAAVVVLAAATSCHAGLIHWTGDAAFTFGPALAGGTGKPANFKSEKIDAAQPILVNTANGYMVTNLRLTYTAAATDFEKEVAIQF